ncbi:hypothetical protein B0T16DRAFT_451765 [Cercophora newfieldiana]|uniref:Uncharacterized protein n=1 Tax=Cercophora newfieldiana TaxID=92897 RepID=A0AA39YP67_9PEZI|nr:hypothetical protein B0T16DRAFT_451765 [Cercophora newfieldiana]
MSWTNPFNFAHPFAVAMLLLILAWAIFSLVESRRLRLNPSAPKEPLQHPQYDEDAKDTITTDPESHQLPTSCPIPIPPSSRKPSLPVLVLPWRSSFSLSPRNTTTDSISAQGRKGSLCPPQIDCAEGDMVSPSHGCPESELVGIGGQFAALKMQAQNRQLSFS